MDGSNSRTRADDAANPARSGETFVGTILWIALAIGVACLALLTLVGSVAHAAAFARVPAPAQMLQSVPAHGASARPVPDATRGAACWGPDADQAPHEARAGRADAAGPRVAGAPKTT